MIKNMTRLGPINTLAHLPAWTLGFFFIVSLVLSSFLVPTARGTLITNGDFETGNFTGWNTGLSPNPAIVSGASALAGSHSAEMPSSGNGFLFQNFGPVVGSYRTEFLFSMPDPGHGGNRALSVFWRSTESGQINLRVVDAGNDGDGDVQVFDESSGWQTVLTDSVELGSTVNSLALTYNDFGTGANYDLTVNGNSNTGLSFFQNAAPNNLSRLDFSNVFSDGSYTIDNVSVAVPEPSSALALVFLAGCTLLRRGRRAVRAAHV